MLALLALGACGAGCNSHSIGDTDAATGDGTDGRDASDADARPAGRCDPASVIDLSASGVRDGGVTEYVGDNESSRGGSIDVPFGNSSLGFYTDPERRVVYPVVFSYTTRSDSSLDVSLGAGTSPTLNGLVAVITRCVGDVSPGDFLGGLRDPFAAARVTTENLAAGTTVYVLAGGQPQAVVALPAPGHVRTNVDVTGTFDLLIRERPVLAPGGPCDGPGGVCATGYHCVFSTCVADGAWGGQCRADGSCDSGLVCRDGSCEREVGIGAACGVSLVCVVGSHCVGQNSVCIADGTRGGACRDVDPACDPGLECAIGYGICIPPRDCGTNGPCAAGESCNMELGRCVVDGAAGGQCRATETPCDAGTRCTHNINTPTLCLTELDDDVACVNVSWTNTCHEGSTCTTVLDGSGLHRCTPRGALWGECRDTQPECDDGLGCDPAASVCLPARAPGESCSGAACVEGYTCPSYASIDPDPRCTPIGQRGARCRATSPACDDGLFCVPGGYYPCCVTALAPGEACGGYGTLAACAPGSDCFGHADGRWYCEPLRECAMPGPACPPDEICGMTETSGRNYLRCHSASP